MDVTPQTNETLAGSGPSSRFHTALDSIGPSHHYLTTDSLELIPVCPADADYYAELFADANVMRYVGLEEGNILTLVETTEIVGKAVSAWEQRGYGRWSIFDRKSERFIGFCGFRCENGEPEFISMIHKKYWGTGVALESAVACVDYGFSTLRLERVNSYCRPNNLRAKGLLEKLGATYIGLIDFHGVEGAAYSLLPPQN